MADVQTGLDRFLQDGPACAGLERGLRVGLLVHPASVDRHAHHALERLGGGASCRPERLFAPEHGMWGCEQDMETVDVATEPTTGLPVISLYGTSAETLRPQAADLEGLDAVVVDLQDVGSRYYTFVYTLSFVMETARECGIPVVVLDRPNPIGGERLEGPLLRPSLASFVGRYPLPVRHGMTIGELARMFNEAFDIGCDLRVVSMLGWRRSMSFDDTGLPWVPPSPNMPTVATALVYPGGCLVEGTNLSEGRGTTTPFELLGAPWLDAQRLAVAARSLDLAGVVFRPCSFRPKFQKHDGASCAGLQVIVSDPATFMPFRTYLALLIECRRLAPEEFGWRQEPYEFETERLAIDLLLGREDLRPRMEAGEPVEQLESLWSEELDEFSERRLPYLLYD